MSHCPICGKATRGPEASSTCELCGKESAAGGICDGGHFVCAGCAQLREMLLVHGERDASVGRNPVAVLLDLMEEPEVPMHDPVHHTSSRRPCSLPTADAAGPWIYPGL